MVAHPPVYVEGKTGRSLILVGEPLANLERHIAGRRTVAVTDQNVKKHWQHLLAGMDTIVIGCGEKYKNLVTVEFIYDQLINRQVDRSTLLVGIGGGITCDITGFVASTYMRGISFGLVPTSLLAQVDASVGGKTGVNHRGFKNMIGAFNQPEFVLCDPELLTTLPEEEITCGLAEIVKHAAIGDPELFAFLEEKVAAIKSRDLDILARLVHRSVTIKAKIVNQDERESGPRRILNFGHTFGHALEKATGIAHGRAVSIGMVLAARLSQELVGLPASESDRLERLLHDLRLSTRLPVPGAKIARAMAMDKKRQQDTIFFVLLRAIGRGQIRQVSLATLQKWLSGSA